MGRRGTPPSEANGHDASTNESPAEPMLSSIPVAESTMSAYTELVTKKHRNLSKRLKNLSKIEDTLKESPVKKLEQDQLDALAKKGELESLSNEFESLKTQFTAFDESQSSKKPEANVTPTSTSAAFGPDDMRRIADIVVAVAAAGVPAISAEHPRASNCIRQIFAHGSDGAPCASGDTICDVLTQYVEDQREVLAGGRRHTGKRVFIAGFNVAVVRRNIETLVAAATAGAAGNEAVPPADATEPAAPAVPAEVDAAAAAAAPTEGKKSRRDRGSRPKRTARETAENGDGNPTPPADDGATTGAAAGDNAAPTKERRSRNRKGSPAGNTATPGDGGDTAATVTVPPGEAKPAKQTGGGRRKPRQPTRADDATSATPSTATPADSAPGSSAGAPVETAPREDATGTTASGSKRPRNGNRKRNGGGKGRGAPDGGETSGAASDRQNAGDTPEIVFLGPSVIQAKPDNGEPSVRQPARQQRPPRSHNNRQQQAPKQPSAPKPIQPPHQPTHGDVHHNTQQQEERRAVAAIASDPAVVSMAGGPQNGARGGAPGGRGRGRGRHRGRGTGRRAVPATVDTNGTSTAPASA